MPVGIPDRSKYGDLRNLSMGDLVDLVAQEHTAKKAGLHTDFRLGDNQGGLLSWAIRKGIPEPGQKYMGIRQPLHAESYKDFEGTIPEGYGAGEVVNKLKGKALITKIDRSGLTFVTASERSPQRFRLQKLADGAWLLINTTSSEKPDITKQHFKTVSPAEVQKIFTPENIVQGKIDGSSEILTILKDKIDSMSFRTSKITGGPISYTEKTGLFKEKAGKKVPVGTQLLAEMYGKRGKKIIPPAELSGILNSTIENSLKAQNDKNVELRHAVHDITRYGNKSTEGMSYPEKSRLIDEILPYLPSSFEAMEGTDVPSEQKALWNRIIAGKYPLTREGIVAHPKNGDVPIKVKPYEEADVIIRELVPGEGKYKIGGFSYAHPDDPDTIVGNVGSGLSDEDREDMRLHPEEWIERIARLKAKEKSRNKAYIAPVFISRHEG